MKKLFISIFFIFSGLFADNHEHHCEDFMSESDCVVHAECEWHADEMACEDAAGDHDGHDHGDEDGDDHDGHDHGEEEHCEDFSSESDCDVHAECEWHADEMACEDAEGDHDDHEMKMMMIMMDMIMVMKNTVKTDRVNQMMITR